MPTHFDVLIVGAGAAGCVLAGRLSEDPALRVGLVEAGPDYGAYDVLRWPAELLDAHSAARGHDWDPGGPSCCARARVVGGCSAHNGCWAVLGAAADHDAWAAFSGGRWDHAALRPYLGRALATLRVRPVRPHDRTVWHDAVIDAGQALGMAYLEDVNAEDAREGVGWVPVNAVGATRWHAAFAYLDPARPRPNLSILAGSLAVRLVFRGPRVTGLVVGGPGGERLLGAGVVVLCCGAYGNPPLLMRSGVGPEDVLSALGAPVVRPLAGVGANLTDHGSLSLPLDPLPALRAVTPDDVYLAQTVVKARSGLTADGLWDLHVVPSAGPGEDARGFYTGPLTAGLHVSTMAPRSRGSVRAASLDPAAAPVIEHGFFTDPDGHDERVVLAGLDLAHELARTPPLAELATAPPPTRWSHEAVLRKASGYWHPVGTCAMGPATDPLAVADAYGRVHGLENLHVADASLMPVIPRANTHVTTVAVADRLAELLAASLAT